MAQRTALTLRKDHFTYLAALCLAKQPIGCRSGKTVGDGATNHTATAISFEMISTYQFYTFTKDPVLQRTVAFLVTILAQGGSASPV